MKLCWKCARVHVEPVGTHCTEEITDRRALRSVTSGDASVGESDKVSDVTMAAKDVEDVILVPVEQDEEEKQLLAELAQEEREGRKLRLKAKIAATKLRNEALEAGKDPPTGPPPNMAPTPGPHQGPVPNQPAPDSKYAINKFLPKLSNIRKANFQELMFGTLEWAIHSDMVEGPIKGYLQHLSYMCLMSASDIYPPDASVDYDLAVREKADSMGMPAFGPGDSNMTMRHYGMSNTWEGRRLAQGPPAAAPSSKKKPAASSSHSASRPPAGPPQPESGCLMWNYEPSCTRGSKCRFPHVCRSCAGDHKAPKCTHK